jgi:hypothetical protein
MEVMCFSPLETAPVAARLAVQVAQLCCNPAQRQVLALAASSRLQVGRVQLVSVVLCKLVQLHVKQPVPRGVFRFAPVPLHAAQVVRSTSRLELRHTLPVARLHSKSVQVGQLVLAVTFR